MKQGLLLLAAGTVTVVSACSLASGKGEVPAPSPLPLRRFGGPVTMQGSVLSSMLELRGPDGNLEAALTIPELDLSALGSGRITHGRVDLSLSYGGSCPGTVRIRGDLQDDARRISGTIKAADCTGRETGKVLFLLRSNNVSRSLPPGLPR